MLTLHYLVRRSTKRLLAKANPQRAQSFFDEDELQVLADSLAAVTATAALAPWSQKAPEVDRVLGLERLPMTAEEIAAELAKLKR